MKISKVAVTLFFSILLGSSFDADAFLIDFESGIGRDGQGIDNIAQIAFTRTDGNNWVYSDITTGRYNAYSIDRKFGLGSYGIYGNVAAWLGTTQGRGRIDFAQKDGTRFKVNYSSATDLYLEAYDSTNNLITTTHAGSTLFGGALPTMNSLEVVAPTGKTISYVVVHDTGNYWIVDNISGDAGKPQQATLTPNINDFPSSDGLFSKIGSFIRDKANQFSDAVDNFFTTQTIALDSWMRQDSVKSAADGAAKVISWSWTAVSDIRTLGLASTAQVATEGLLINHAMDAICANNNCRDDAVYSRAIAQSVLSLGIKIGSGQVDPVSLLLWLNSSIWKILVVPQLKQIANDPYDPNYNALFEPTPLALPDLPSSGNILLDSRLADIYKGQQQIYLNLKGVNVSYDRYAAALQASDAESAALQLQAILYYLGLYNDELQDMATGLYSLQSLLQGIGYQDMAFDSTLLADIQTSLATNGFSPDEITLLDSLGVPGEGIDTVRQDILGLDPKMFPTSFYSSLDNLAGSYRQSSALESKSVPEPPSYTLVLLAFLLMQFVRRRGKRRSPIASIIGQPLISSV